MSRPVTVLTFDIIAVLNIFMPLLKEAFAINHNFAGNNTHVLPMQENHKHHAKIPTEFEIYVILNLKNILQ